MGFAKCRIILVPRTYSAQFRKLKLASGKMMRRTAFRITAIQLFLAYRKLTSEALFNGRTSTRSAVRVRYATWMER